MKLFASIYTDEDVSKLVATLLRARGFDVMTTSEQGMLTQSDNKQLAYAASIERCLLTHNRVDFERSLIKKIAIARVRFGMGEGRTLGMKGRFMFGIATALTFSCVLKLPII